MFFCIHYMNYTSMSFFFFYILSVVWQLDVLRTCIHVLLYALHELHKQHVLFLLLYFECCMATWCIKNLYTCSFVYIIWITPACSFSFFYILSVVWQLDVLRTCIHVLLYTLYELHQNVLFLLLYFECCMTTWCIKNLYTCSFVYIIWITPECSFSFFYVFWDLYDNLIKNLYTCSFVLCISA